MSFSPEPWKLTVDDGGPEGPALRDATGRIVADVWGAENGRRIVACVNALAGMPTEKIGGMAELRQQGTAFMIHRAGDLAQIDDTLAGAGTTIESMAQQRTRLLAAINGLLPFVTGNWWPGVVADPAIDAAVAIAREIEAAP